MENRMTHWLKQEQNPKTFDELKNLFYSLPDQSNQVVKWKPHASAVNAFKEAYETIRNETLTFEEAQAMLCHAINEGWLRNPECPW
jgi:hypothetical protein